MRSRYATRYRHGETGTRLYTIWCVMKHRCNSPKDISYQWYGGKGIRVCAEWEQSYESFRDWAKANGYADGLTIDRIDGNKDYSPDNCRWASMKAQQNNRCNNHIIRFNGEEHTLSEWADIIGIKPKTLSRRIVDKGWSVEKALTTPLCLSKSHDKRR